MQIKRHVSAQAEPVAGHGADWRVSECGLLLSYLFTLRQRHSRTESPTLSSLTSSFSSKWVCWPGSSPITSATPQPSQSSLTPIYGAAQPPGS